MQMQLTRLLSALVLVTASSVLASAATAQQTDNSGFERISLESVEDTFDRAFYNESGDFYHNRSLPRQAAFIIGPGLPGGAGFPDLEIERDAKLINTLYEDVLEQQVSSDPVIRTPDLPNPFNTTLRSQTGNRQIGSRVEGSEFFFDVVPPR